MKDHRSYIRNLSSCKKSDLIFATAKVAYILTASIFHLFIISSAVQIYEFSYIHYHFITIAGIYRTH